MGITDDDLKNIHEKKPNKYRIFIGLGDDRRSKTISGIREAILEKRKMLKELGIETDANEIEVSIEKEIDKPNEFADLTVREGFDKYFENKLKLVTNKKIELTTYEKDLEIHGGRFIRDSKLLDKKIIDLTDDDAQEFVDGLYAASPVKDGVEGDKLSINTIYNPYALFHRAFEHFRKGLKVIKINPFSDVENKPKYTPKDQKYLTSKEIKFVLERLENTNIRFRCLVNLGLETGLRVEEISAIKWSDINRMRITLKIVRALVKSRITKELIIKDVKTTDSEREICISQHTLELLDNYRKFKWQCGFLVSNDDFVFTALDSNDLVAPEQHSIDFRKFIRKLGFEVPFRNLRHTSATFMLLGETNIKAVKKRFGWSKDSSVMNIYNQSNLDEDRKLIDKFDEEFRNAVGASYSELYCICVDRFNNRRKLNNIMQKITGKPAEEINLDEDLNICKDYLFELFPVFSKIAEIDSKLDDEEVGAIFEGFKPIYRRIKIEPLEPAYSIKI